MSMRNKLVALACIVGLMVPAASASAHTTHSHTCNGPFHSVQLDGNGWKHDSIRVSQSNQHWSSQRHYQWVSLDGGFWLYKHTYKSATCNGA